ncbi:MAG: class I SAM-dependent methyltransferase [Candidatus Omnitrophica bacterium]|nr:class I SAM-dependent methyltransferase [Candidatus Omnitrophota bacterium]
MKDYLPKEHFDAEAERSSPGEGENPGKFSFHSFPPWSRCPQWWDFIEKDMKVLDIGSGIGTEVGKLNQRKVFAVGCDVAPKMIELAKKNCLAHGVDSAKFVLWDGINLPFQAGSFHRITTNTVLQHVVDDSKLENIFSQVNRVLIPGGLFLISEIVGVKTSHVYSHVKVRTRKDYIYMAGKKGFTLIANKKQAKLYLSLNYAFCLLRLFSRRWLAGKKDVPGPATRQQEDKKSNPLAFKRRLDKFCQRIDHVLDKMHFFPLLVTQDSMVFKKEG